MEEKTVTSSSSININDRRGIVLTGVKKIDSFNEKEFLLDTTLGYVTIKGEELEIIKLDTYQGNVSIKGIFNSLSYKEAVKNKDESILSKLFKWELIYSWYL